MDKSKQKLALMAVIILVALAVVFGLVYKFTKRVPVALPPAQNMKPSQAKMEDERRKTEEILKTDPTDPVHVSNLKYVQSALERYYNDTKQYPKSLTELVPMYLRVLPKYSSSKDYFYAYYPKDKPKAYHLGSLLGGRNPADVEAFKTDADFNSEKAGYENGFNGMDPVYDLVGNKK